METAAAFLPGRLPSVLFFCGIIRFIMEEGFYFLERYTEHFLRSIRVEKVIYEGRTKFQYVQIFSNKLLGKTLFLDLKIQSAEIDEFVYHESLVHPAMMTHPRPRDVLIIGGGEGATLREVLRHGDVEKAVMVDIDRKLVHVCRKYLPEWSAGAFSDPRTKVVFGDAARYVEKTGEKFDVVVSDLTEPVHGGPSIYLFTKEFFEKIAGILKEEGVFVLQAGSSDLFYQKFFSSCVRTLEEVFPLVRPYWTFMFSYNSPWGFALASRKADPLKAAEKVLEERGRQRGVEGLRYYHPGLHRGMFALPLYLQEGFRKGRVLTDASPFIWEL